MFARGALKKLYRPDLDASGAALALLQALYDAADDDSATGGPDLARRIFPVVLVATADGVQRVRTPASRSWSSRSWPAVARVPTARPRR